MLVVVALVLFGVAGATYFFFFRTRTISSVESLGDDFTQGVGSELERSLPLVSVELNGESTDVRAFYLDCKQQEFDKALFISQLNARAPEFSKLRVSLGTQPIFDGERAGQTEEAWTSTSDALVTIAGQFDLDPRVLATLIELETGGLTNPLKHPLYPLLYPDSSGLKDEFQVQVGIASDAINKNRATLKLDESLAGEESLTSQAILSYLSGKNYTVARMEEFTKPTTGQSFVGIFQKFFETDPRVCRS